MIGSLAEELGIPDRSELMEVIPAQCFQINERIAFTRLACLLFLTIGSGVIAYIAMPHSDRYDDTPIIAALWRAATQRVVLRRVEGDTWYF
jgi:hypothetical protein